MSSLIIDPPDLYNDYFAGAGSCILCHNSQVDEEGNSIAIVNDWRSTMKANAARDPFWQAKVSHETLVNPHLKNEIETICSRCHAPMGNINASLNGAEFYSLVEMNADPIAMDGVSCTVCHQITEESMGNSSGNFIIGENKQIFGPYTAPFANPMIQNTTYTPVYGEHIKDSRLCESCHTLITHPVDLNGVPTGGEFVEQAPYQEWENSVYSQNGTSCYTCHIPEIEDVVKISTMPPWLDGRTPFGKHHFAGANVFMLKMLKSNIDELGITANETQFDSSISRTYKNLQLNTISTELIETNRNDDSLYLDLKLINLAGHKLPTAYPSRRVFVELYATNNSGDTIFHSGKHDSDFNILYEDEDYEAHHNYINQNQQVQIYEMVMGDINGDYTTVLERSAFQLKDNRIPPNGFKTNHFSYDTVKIMGNALTDSDFNKIETVEGSGTDIIHYAIATSNDNEDVNITAKIYYQTVTSRWLEEMFSYESDAINSFKSMYDQADKAAVLLASNSMVSTYVSIHQNSLNKTILYPNPSKGSINIDSQVKINTIDIFNIGGSHLSTIYPENTSDIHISDQAGVYLLVLNSGDSKMIKKVIINQ